MRATGFLLVAVVFIAVSLLTYAIIRAVDWKAHDFALVAGAIVSSQIGVLVWHRQSPTSSEPSVKLGLGALLSVTAMAFTLIFQAVSGWLTYPEVTAPIAAVGCFVFPFIIVGPLWKSLTKRKPPESQDAGSGVAARDRRGM
jgi:hypothetical protein